MNNNKNNRKFLIVSIFLLFILIACGGSDNTASKLQLPDVPLQEAQVVKIVDGDTIDVLIDGTKYRIRYILVNTPETHGKVEPFGLEATKANRRLVEDKTVFLEKDVSETDRYNRLLRYVYVDGLMVNEELLRLGMAHVVTFPPDIKYIDRFLEIQKQAQDDAVGLWE